MREMPSHEETLYVLQNKSLMEQIERSLKTHWKRMGYRPSPEELEALDHSERCNEAIPLPERASGKPES